MVEEQKSLTRNFLYNLFQQGLNVALPLLTVPYLSRVLGPEGLGLVAFSGSIVQYFILLGGMGLALYGNRAVARVRQDNEERSRTFWEIFSLRASLTTIALFCFLISLLAFKPAHIEVYIVQSVLILASALDLSWLFMAMEDFKRIAIRNTAIRLVGLALIFILVRQPGDFVKYVLITVLTELAGQGVYWTRIRSLVQRPEMGKLSLGRHLPPAGRLFVPQLAIQVYVVLDKTMLGLLSNLAEVALYAQPQKIIKALLMLVTTLGTVMLPRMSHLYANKREGEFRDYARKSLLFTLYGTFLFSALTFVISPAFIPLFLGKDFSRSVIVFQLLSPIIVLIGLSNVLGIQMLLPMGKERLFSVSVITGAVVNFSGNLVLIPLYGATGAAVSTLLAEFLVTAIQCFSLRRDGIFPGLYKEFSCFLIGSASCIAVSLPLKTLISNPVTLTGLSCLSGTAAYIAALWLCRSETQRAIFKHILKTFGGVA